MKLFQNPIVVAVLACLALGLVVKNVIWPIVKPTGRSKSVAKAAPPAAATQPAAGAPKTRAIKTTAKSDEQPLPVPTADIARAEVASASARWTTSPRRDPFQLANDRSGRTARDLLTLSAIWRQTASTLAVINNRVLAEGESILEFRVETIDDDRVWVQGPAGREWIEFKVPGPPDSESEESLPLPAEQRNIVAQSEKR